MNRRQFLRDSALASASVALMGATRFAAHAESAPTDSRIELLEALLHPEPLFCA